ncbi:glucose-induced degradation protein 8-B homolog isoform X2 [Impatiens glandulifera]|uniref:glucose-induced degradation protein 8-B homolog isoform X2 n=1 Tax=Impatiens glandulifera TaxID=253017 RepID=UPI001FB0BB53|nr:glucose-induced degradation protein 8-B homolog isoform X2 [Impatiens glandulifera]
MSEMDVDPRQYENIAVDDNVIQNVVLSYLVHSCYKETIESFITCTGMKRPAVNLDDMDKRKWILQFVLDGNALKAIELTEQFAPDLLEKNKDLHFDLLSLHFVELVCSRKCTDALEFAQMKLTPFGKDFMALLAYEEPEKSPMFHLLSLEYKQNVADNLNRAILGHANLPSYSTIERLIQQTSIVRQILSQDQGKEGFAGFSLKDYLKS